MFCSHCGKELPTDESKFCPSCGKQVKNETAVTVEIPLNISYESEGDLKLFIGKNEDYYLRKWSKMRSWNWAAFFIGVFWLGYRKMYLYLGLFYLLFIILDVIGNALHTSSTISIVGSILLGMFGNTMYNTHAKNKLAEINKLNPELRNTEVIRQGGVSWGGVAISFLGLIVYCYIVYLIDLIM